MTPQFLHTMPRPCLARKKEPHPNRRSLWFLLLGSVLICACGTPKQENPRLTVAAAANLKGVFDEIAREFQLQTDNEVVLSFGSTAQLAKQIENGAPFDVFAAADIEHVDQLAASGKLLAESKVVYAHGQLALWVPQGETLDVHALADLVRPEIRYVSIAQPELAPYGEAAVQALKTAGLWERLKPKIVYAANINMARQYAQTGNADAALTAYSLVLNDPGVVAKVDEKLYSAIRQAMGIVAESNQLPLARQFAGFVTSAQGRAILRRHGYSDPR